MEVKETLLQTLRFGFQQYVGMRAAKQFANVNANCYYNSVMDAMCFSLEALVLSERLQTYTVDFSVDVPATAWQHFKREYMPKWFVDKWPVKYRTIKEKKQIELLECYPSLPIKPGESRFQYIRHVDKKELYNLKWKSDE